MGTPAAGAGWTNPGLSTAASGSGPALPAKCMLGHAALNGDAMTSPDLPINGLAAHDRRNLLS